MKIGILHLVFSIAFFKTGRSELHIRPLGTIFIKPLGSSIVFTCEFISRGDNYRDELPVWLEKGHPIIENHERRYVDEDYISNTRKLYIINILEEDVGEYTCARGSEKINIQLHIFKDISFDDAPSVQYVELGREGLVRCAVSGTPLPRVTWRKRSRRIGTSDARFILMEEGLKILNVTEEDGGQYTCRAEVDVDGRYSDQRIVVVVNYPPSITKGIGHIEALEGSPAFLSCEARGSPAPSVKYFKVLPDNVTEDVLPSPNDTEVNEEVLTLVNVSRSHEGQYMCIAVNSLGSRSQLGSLRVLVPPRAIIADVFSSTIGMNATVSCLGRGDPKPYMSFIRRMGGRNLNLSEAQQAGSRVHLESFNVSLHLTVMEVNINDSDIYTCVCLSSVGESREDSRLVVQYGPIFDSNMSSLAYGWTGKVVNLTCNVRGEPEVALRWLKGQELIENNQDFFVHESNFGSTLQVTLRGGDDQYGAYTCMGTNSLGSSEFNFTIEEAFVPDAPEATVMRLRPNDVIVTIASDHSLETTFQVTWYFLLITDESNITRNMSVPVGIEQRRHNSVTMTTAIIEDLAPSTSYVLFLRAVNEVGLGDPARIEFKTDELRIPDTVVANVTLLDLNSVTLTWRPPYSGGSNIIGYLISHRKVKSKVGGSYEPSSIWKELQCCSHHAPLTVVSTGRIIHQDEALYHHMLTQDRFTFEIVNLDPSSVYQVKVMAINSVGHSIPQPDFFVETIQGKVGFLPSFLQTPNGTFMIGLMLAVVVILLVIIDISCYVMNGCGVTMCCCVYVCGRQRKHTSPGKKKIIKDDVKVSMRDVSLKVDEQLPAEANNESLQVVIVGSSTLESVKMSFDSDLIKLEVSGEEEEEEEERCLLEEGMCQQSEDATPPEDVEILKVHGSDGGDDDDSEDELPPPPLPLISSVSSSHTNATELITPKNRRSIMSFGDARWKDVVLELESQLGVKRVDPSDDRNSNGDDDAGDDEDEYTGPSSPKWRHI